jgi:hypothetical protein
MLTEQDLHDALAEAADDREAERFTLGLSDRALAEARSGGLLRRPMAGLRGKRGRWLPAIAVGSALTVAGAFGVSALGNGSGGGFGGGPRLATMVEAPATPANPVGQSALTEFGVECFNGPTPSLEYVWDPAAQQYRGFGGGDNAYKYFLPSPDGEQALVERGMPPTSQAWAVASWSDALAGRLVFHPIADGFGVHWTADGKEVVTEPSWGGELAQNTRIVLKNKNADFFDPATGRFLASVPIPQQVRTMAASGQWSVQQWQGDHDTVQFPLVSTDGDHIVFLNAHGDTVRTLTLKDGLPADPSAKSEGAEVAEISPDGRYLAEESSGQIATFDLTAGGKRIGSMDAPHPTFQGWTGDHQIVTAAEEAQPSANPTSTSFPRTGHTAVYSVLSPELKVMQRATFVLPGDPQGECATWPMSWAPKGQFPGAFVP